MENNSLDLPYYNSTSYPLAIKKQLEMLEYTDEIKAMLHFHQFIPKEFFTRNSGVRGLLFVHTMGTGKTRLAVAIADYFRENEPRRQINVLLPKSLEGNFRSTITAITKKDPDKHFKFISLNASNMFKQVKNIKKNKEEMLFEKKLEEFITLVDKNSLDNSMLIIDEAHNLFNGITNGSKNAVQLYDLIIRAKNIKLIFLTGTPIVNDPFELVPCFNMLRGPLPLEVKTRVNRSGAGRGISKHTDKETTLLFSESYDEFEDYFIDRSDNSVKNKDKFANRIYGLSSYYGDLYFPPELDREGFPKKLPFIIEKVPMSIEQYASYTVARTQELEEDKKRTVFKSKHSRFSSSNGGGSTYRVKSRQISNYAIPEYALGPLRGAKSREKFIQKITDEDLLNTLRFSPKMKRILENIDIHRGQLGLVYSQFVSGEGLGIFSRILDTMGWRNFLTSAENIDAYDIKTNVNTYAILSGAISPEDRLRMIKSFNNTENKDGSVIRLLLMSGAVAEGIDLKRIRHVHVMEPFWNYARINQVATRAIRYLSHEDLPENERNVQVYIYLSDYPRTIPDGKINEPTTDVSLYEKSINNMIIINNFLQVIAETSIDCNIHYYHLPDIVKRKINCKLCAPDDAPLFHPLIQKDMTIPSMCKTYSEVKLAVSEISIPETDEKFYYKKNNNHIDLFMFDDKLQGYTAMPQTHPYYSTIMSKLYEDDNNEIFDALK